MCCVRHVVSCPLSRKRLLIFLINTANNTKNSWKTTLVGGTENKKTTSQSAISGPIGETLITTSAFLKVTQNFTNFYLSIALSNHHRYITFEVSEIAYWQFCCLSDYTWKNWQPGSPIWRCGQGRRLFVVPSCHVDNEKMLLQTWCWRFFEWIFDSLKTASLKRSHNQ